jgi:hypothetical protein
MQREGLAARGARCESARVRSAHAACPGSPRAARAGSGCAAALEACGGCAAVGGAPIVRALHTCTRAKSNYQRLSSDEFYNPVSLTMSSSSSALFSVESVVEKVRFCRASSSRPTRPCSPGSPPPRPRPHAYPHDATGQPAAADSGVQQRGRCECAGAAARCGQPGCRRRRQRRRQRRRRHAPPAAAAARRRARPRELWR